MTKIAVVTGSSSGIGYETSLLLARNQYSTYASIRNLKKSSAKIFAAKSRTAREIKT